MNRFRKGHRHLPLVRKFHLTFLAFLGLILLFMSGLNDVSEKTDESQLESLHSAIERDIAHCYALEGTYPPSLEYLKQHYGLIYDEERFFVDYRSIGSNIMPDVTIIER